MASRRSVLRASPSDDLRDGPDRELWGSDEDEDALVQFDIRSPAPFVATDSFEALGRNPSQNYLARKVLKWQ